MNKGNRGKVVPVDRQHNLAYVWELIDEGKFEQARLKLESPTSLDSFAADERHSGEFLLYYLYLITTPNDSLEKRISLLLKIIERDTYRYAATERLSEEALRDKRVIQMEVFLNFVKNCRNPEVIDAIYRIRWSGLGVDGYMTIINDVNWLQKRALDIGESRFNGFDAIIDRLHDLECASCGCQRTLRLLLPGSVSVSRQ